jgi:hypothetical protein
MSVHMGPKQPRTQWASGAFPRVEGVKRLGPEAGHSLPSRADIKNGEAVSAPPTYVFMAGA